MDGSIINLFKLHSFTNNKTYIHDIKFRILNKTCNVDEIDQGGNNLLILSLYACLGHSKKYRLIFDDLSEFLINNGIDINHINKEGISPIHMACQRDNIKLIKLIISKNCFKTINKRDYWGMTPIQYTDRRNILKLLKKAGAEEPIKNDSD